MGGWVGAGVGGLRTACWGAAHAQPAATLERLLTPPASRPAPPPPALAVAAKAADGSACPGTQPPKFTKAQVEATMWGTAAPSVGSTYSQCSGGKTKLTAATSLVADVVDLPCTGASNGVAWSTATCNFDDFVGWADAADAALTARGIDLAKYKYK